MVVIIRRNPNIKEIHKTRNKETFFYLLNFFIFYTSNYFHLKNTKIIAEYKWDVI